MEDRDQASDKKGLDTVRLARLYTQQKETRWCLLLHLHKSLSQYVRDAAMDKDVTVIDGVDDLIRELRRQGNNLNQLVVMARQGHVELVNMEPFMEVYENTWQTLNSLLSLVG